MSRFEHDQSRRAFLGRAGALGLAGVAGPFANSLGIIGEAAAATATDYKALVCVFLHGGMDYANTLVPYDEASYAAYRTARPNLALERDALGATALAPTVGGGRRFALAPTMAPLKPLFDQGKMAVMLNLGTLVMPTTKQQYLQNTAKLPPSCSAIATSRPIFRRRCLRPPRGGAAGWATSSSRATARRR